MSAVHVRARREQILRAALSCFARKGFQKSTMREICREARLSPGAVYLYFRSKQAIVEALAGEYARARQRLFEDSAASNAREELFTFLEGLAGAGADGGAGSATVREAAKLDVRVWAESLDSAVLRRVVQGATSEMVDRLETILRRGRDRGELGADIDPRGLAYAVLSLIAGLSLQTAIDPDFEPVPYREAVGALLRAVFERAPRRGASPS